MELKRTSNPVYSGISEDLFARLRSYQSGCAYYPGGEEFDCIKRRLTNDQDVRYVESTAPASAQPVAQPASAASPPASAPVTASSPAGGTAEQFEQDPTSAQLKCEALGYDALTPAYGKCWRDILNGREVKSYTSPTGLDTSANTALYSREYMQWAFDSCIDEANPEGCKAQLTKQFGMTPINSVSAPATAIPQSVNAIEGLRARAQSMPASSRPCDADDSCSSLSTVRQINKEECTTAASGPLSWLFGINQDKFNTCIVQKESSQGISSSIFPDASTEAARLQGTHQQALENTVVPPGYWDPNGPYPLGADDKILGQEPVPPAEGLSYYTNGISNFFKGLFGSGASSPGSRSSEPAYDSNSSRNVVPGPSSPFPSDAEARQESDPNAPNSIKAITDFFSSWRWFSDSNTDTTPLFDANKEYADGIYKEAPLNAFNDDEFGPAVGSWVRQNEPVENPTFIEYDPDTNYLRPEIEALPVLYPDDSSQIIQTNIGPTSIWDQRIEGFILGDDQSETLWKAQDNSLCTDCDSSYAEPAQHYSAVPFSEELFNQSLVASAFGAFLLKSK
ncbi:MAG TPA: hypothetical protein VJH69_02865 [Candidatus Paceibacterota bacterium]